MKNLLTSEQCAFMLGYAHGLLLGNEDNPYHGSDQAQLSNAYKSGYESGVNDYKEKE